MEEISTFCRGISLDEMKHRLAEMHYELLLNEKEGSGKTPRERYEVAVTIDFLTGLIQVVEERINHHEILQQRTVKMKVTPISNK